MISINRNNFPALGGTFTLVLTKSDYMLWLSVDPGSESWYNVLSSQQVGPRNWEIEVEVDENDTASTRTMYIQVETEVEQETFEVVQAASFVPTQPEAVIKSITPSGNIGAAGGTLTVDVIAQNANDSLTSAAVSTGGNYVTLQSTTHGITSGTDTVTRFVFEFAANANSSSRTATLSFTVSNGSLTDTVSTTKTQEGTTVSASLVAQSPTGSVASSGGTWTVDIEAVNGNDSLSTALVSSGSFCTLQSTTHGVTSEGRTVTRFVFSFAANTGTTGRYATIEATVSNGTITDTISLNKLQDGTGVSTPTIDVRDEVPSGSMPGLGGLVTYDVHVDFADDNLTTASVTSGASFVTLVSTTHGILSQGYLITRFVFQVLANDTDQQRSFSIQFTGSNGTLTATTSAMKNQDAGVLEADIQEPNFSVLAWYHSLEEQNSAKWWVRGKIYPLYTQGGYLLPFQIIRRHRSSSVITLFEIYTSKGILVGDYTADIISAGITIKSFATYDVIVFPGRLPVFTGMSNGQYYAKISDGNEIWYSEIFTVVNDMEPYLKIEWWDNEDFITDGGTVVYTSPTFHNILYLEADVAKPEYKFEEEGETRDGYFFPAKQISEKKYKFTFLAPEYLLDVIRLIRMSDYVFIYYRGKKFAADTFLITPEWEDEGDLAKVSAEFETATIAKKLGLGYLRGQQGGDYNDDYNDDYLS